MASYNAYIGTLATGKEIFSTELQEMKFFSEYLRAVTKIKSDFAQEVKEKGNWQTAGWDEDEIDDLARPVHDHNGTYQNNKASREVVLKTIKSKWETEKAKYIR